MENKRRHAFYAQKIYHAWWILRITYGTLFIVVGADKFVNLLTNWHQFIGKATLDLLPFSSDIFLLIFGIIQMGAGILLFTHWLYWGIYIIFALLMLIFINLLSAPSSIVVMSHDLFMIIGMTVLIQLTTIIRSEKAYNSN